MTFRKEDLKRAEHYCAYQERCPKEVEQKLLGWNIGEEDARDIVDSLQKTGFLSEERFAEAFAGGEFRNNQWGKVKIRYALLERGIPEKVVARALEMIDPVEYREQAERLIKKKRDEIKTEKKLTIRSKIYNFAIGKGYEPDLILEILRDLKI